MSRQIPIIDLKPWFDGNQGQRRELCRRVNRICHEIGFFYIVNHGISTEQSEYYLAMLRAFFELPLATRQAIDKHYSAQFRGWEQLGSELTNNEVDYREQIDIGVERDIIENPDPYYMALVGPNQWPPEDALPGFRASVNDFFAGLSAVARELLRIMSLALGLEQGHIEKVFGANPSPYLKLIRYPRTLAGGQGVGIHKDSGFLTLLLQDENPGLEAQANDNTWHRVEPIAGSLVVNTGELLQLITHNYFIATPHRVINLSDCERHSSAFFYSPDLNTPLEPLPIDSQYIEMVSRSERHRGEGLMASRSEMAAGTGGMGSRVRPLVFGEKYWQRWVRSYPEIARKYYPDLMQ
ncbi:MAG: isopenicillin N synthase family oxygenase [Gammaproteobacteria bacterium]|nr:MAG: isopenicillin N synthase family oxygenase [Gammaproteobacteria bacterium]